MKKIKHIIRKIPIIGSLAAHLLVWLESRRFSGSQDYWENRYKSGGNSGDGSYGELAEFKARVLNNLVSDLGFQTVIELGCGDGNQLLLADYPSYYGFDVSKNAIDQCRESFSQDSTKTFQLMSDLGGHTADLSLSLDVIYHLVEDDVFENYLHALFAAATKMVVIYASNTDKQETPQLPHVRHRKFTNWIGSNCSEWYLSRTIDNEIPYDQKTDEGSAANFFVFEKRSQRYENKRRE